MDEGLLRKGKHKAESKHHLHHKPCGKGAHARKQQHWGADDGLHFFKGKKHARNGRAKGRRQASHAAAHKVARQALLAPLAPQMAHARAHGSAHHNGRPLAANRKPAAERNQGSAKFAQQYAQPVHAHLPAHHKLYLRNTAATHKGLYAQGQQCQHSQHRQPAKQARGNKGIINIVPVHHLHKGCIDVVVAEAKQAYDPAGNAAGGHGLQNNALNADAAQGIKIAQRWRNGTEKRHGESSIIGLLTGASMAGRGVLFNPL